MSCLSDVAASLVPSVKAAVDTYGGGFLSGLVQEKTCGAFLCSWDVCRKWYRAAVELYVPAQGWSSRFPPTSSYTVGKAEKVDFGELFAGEGSHRREHVPPHCWLPISSSVSDDCRGKGLHRREHVPPHFWLDGLQVVE